MIEKTDKTEEKDMIKVTDLIDQDTIDQKELKDQKK